MQRRPHHIFQNIQIDGFYDISESPHLHTFLCGLQGASYCGKHYNMCVREEGLDLLQRLHPVHERHPDIHKNNIGPEYSGFLQGRSAVVRNFGDKLTLKIFLKESTDVDLIVNHHKIKLHIVIFHASPCFIRWSKCFACHCEHSEAMLRPKPIAPWWRANR